MKSVIAMSYVSILSCNNFNHLVFPKAQPFEEAIKLEFTSKSVIDIIFVIILHSPLDKLDVLNDRNGFFVLKMHKSPKVNHKVH